MTISLIKYAIKYQSSWLIVGISIISWKFSFSDIYLQLIMHVYVHVAVCGCTGLQDKMYFVQ